MSLQTLNFGELRCRCVIFGIIGLPNCWLFFMQFFRSYAGLCPVFICKWFLGGVLVDVHYIIGELDLDWTTAFLHVQHG